ncbi:hypothetical protein Acr_00g0057120 [Actinidia rufa]|uniref:Putative plant transposon protein domain-containing protein n=1 Tax=Actinidia rufa TaxID=165716 RepID=A0A7J0DNY1_9ERIC|nr:hypothetical protein Acr_00g0057120 [Actinidia rufa]
MAPKSAKPKKQSLVLVVSTPTVGWKSMTVIRDEVYPDLVAHFYANATREYGQDSIDSYVKRVGLTLDRSVIRKILGLGFGGEIYREKAPRKVQLKALYGVDIDEYVQPTANDLPLETRLVHHYVCAIFIPKAGKYKHGTDRELFFLWAYLMESRIDLPMFILYQMHRATMNKVNNVATRLLFVDRKVRESKKEMRLMKMGKEEWKKEEEEKEKEEGKEAEKEEDEQEEEEKKGDQERGEGADQEEDESDEVDSSDKKSDVPLLTRKVGHEYSLRKRGATKFSNTMDTPLILTPSPPPSPQPTTPIHVSSPRVSPSRTSPPLVTS